MSTFLTVERAREIPALAGADATYLSHLAAAACEAVERYCKRAFALTSYTAEYHDGGGETSLFVENFPVTALQSVTIVEPGGGQVQIEAAGFDVNAGTGEVRFKAGASGGYDRFPKGFRNIKVSYTAGFEEVPEAVKEAAAQLAAHLHSSAAREGGVAAEKLGQYSRRFAAAGQGMPAAVRQLLAPYRDVRV